MAFPVPRGTLIPEVSWPGLTAGVQQFRYTCSHGITPGIALVVTNPLARPPADVGHLRFSDGRRGRILRNCRVNRMTSAIGAGGYVYTMEIQDRRWQWEHGTFPNGGAMFNQLDPNNKLIPWTIRSPVELAIICLEALGEKNYLITGLPKGLTSADGRRASRYLKTGENYPITAANPPVNWEGLTPAAALSELCDRYGCRVIFQPHADRVLIARQGDGKPLSPAGSLAQASLSVEAPATPRAVGVYGAPSLYQMRLALEPVGLEWDGNNHYEPLAQLSYGPTPSDNSQKQITVCEVRPAADALTATLTAVLDGIAYTGVGIVGLLAKMAGSPLFSRGNVSVLSSTASSVTFIGKTVRPFSCQCRISFGSSTRSRFDARLNQPHKYQTADWSKAAPPYFAGVNATDRLAIIEARALAQKSVWRAYRVINEDVEVAHQNARDRLAGLGARWRPIYVPGYGYIQHRLQLVISGFMVDQVVPAPRREAAIVRGQNELAAAGLLPEYYNGLARNQSARVYGQYAKHIGGVLWHTKANLNTDPMTLCKVPFQVDPWNQVIVFEEPVYRSNDQGGQGIFRDPELILECAVTVRELPGWTERRPSYVRTLPGGLAPPEFITRDDVVANFVGVYQDATNHVLRVTRPPEDADGPRRAQAYVESIALKYLQKPAQAQTWNGIMAIEPDGVVQQITWEIGPQGIFTTAGANGEFSTYLPSFATRRSRENLAANPQAALANARDQHILTSAALAGGLSFSAFGRS